MNAIRLFDLGTLSEVPQEAIALTEQWQRFDVTFAELRSGTSVSGIDFIVDGRGGNFEVWIDDLSLICNQACPSVEF